MTDLAVFVAAAALVGALGLIIGSFLNVLIYRVPLGRSIVRPGSACPACEAPISARDNIPILSWLVLRGRCRACSVPISARYPLVEGANAALWVALLTWARQPAGINSLLPLLLVLASAGLALALIDLDHHRLPDVIVLPLYPITVAGLAFAGVVGGQWPLASTLAGAAIWLAVIGGMWLISAGRGMGFGDVKLAPVLGATLGWAGLSCAVVGILAAFGLGAVIGLGLLVSGRAGRGSHLAFGPFLLAGSAVGLVAGPFLADWYLPAVTG